MTWVSSWLTVLGPDLVGVGHEVAAGLVKQVQQGVAVEVDPDEGADFGWAVEAGILGLVVTLAGGFCLTGPPFQE